MNIRVRLAINYTVKFMLPLIACIALLSTLWADGSPHPLGETIAQWVWFDYAALFAAACIGISLLAWRKQRPRSLVEFVPWALFLCGAVEVILGTMQLCGWEVSNHARFAVTGSFLNPGPYSGFLALILPVCLQLHLEGWQETEYAGASRWESFCIRVQIVVTAVIGLLAICLLAAAMSRAAWLAAGVSCLWVYGKHNNWWDRLRRWRWEHPTQETFAIIGGICLLAMAVYLLFMLKPDSALGRLLIWSISLSAMLESPLIGHPDFAGAYGDAQEYNFQHFTGFPWEERVAGSPEYAFNEYLQFGVEWGVIAMCLAIWFLYSTWKNGCAKRCYGICGAFLSLLIFAFFSYPLQLPPLLICFFIIVVTCRWKQPLRHWITMAIGLALIGAIRLPSDLATDKACREWANTRVLYHTGVHKAAVEEYKRLYPYLKENDKFLFEYGHCLHKLGEYKASNEVLESAIAYSSDPMILNIIGKNYHAMQEYKKAEKYLRRAIHRLPGRIYPYYLLAKLYAEPYFQDKPHLFERMKRIVDTKTPKVMSTAIREMRQELERISDERRKNKETRKQGHLSSHSW